MTMLVTATITAAVTGLVGPTLQLRSAPSQATLPTNVLLQANFTYGSGGLTADAWVQTSLDGGNVWCDVANFHFTTASGKALFNLYSGTPITTQFTTFTDGALAANTSKDGFIGPLWRVKYTTTGTYAGNTTLRVDAFTNGLTSLS